MAPEKFHFCWYGNKEGSGERNIMHFWMDCSFPYRKGKCSMLVVTFLMLWAVMSFLVNGKEVSIG